MSRALALAAALLAHPAGAADAPTSIASVRVEVVSDASPSAALERVGRKAEPEWIGWSAAAVPDAGELCCFGKNFKRRGCSLTDRDASWGSSDRDGASHPAEIFVLVEVTRGRPTRVRLVSPSCPVDGGGRRLLWLGAVPPAASLALLGRLVEAGDAENVSEPALAAAAHHAAPGADALVEHRALDRSLGSDAREQAMFWAGNTRGDAGYRLLDRVLGSEPDGELRQHALFALTQSRTAGAFERIQRAGIEDRDGEVRSQAMFWLAQSDAPGAGEWILGRLDAERDPEVREQAVFALSQLDDGTDRLLSLVRSKRDPEIVRQALFWLGQSDDPRALEEIEKILEK